MYDPKVCTLVGNFLQSYLKHKGSDSTIFSTYYKTMNESINVCANTHGSRLPPIDSKSIKGYEAVFDQMDGALSI